MNIDPYFTKKHVVNKDPYEQWALWLKNLISSWQACVKQTQTESQIWQNVAPGCMIIWQNQEQLQYFMTGSHYQNSYFHAVRLA